MNQKKKGVSTLKCIRYLENLRHHIIIMLTHCSCTSTPHISTSFKPNSTIQGYQSGAPVQTLLVSLGRLLNKPKKIALLDEVRQLIKDVDLAVYDEEVLIWRETGVPPGTTVATVSFGAKGQKQAKAFAHREPTYKVYDIFKYTLLETTLLPTLPPFYKSLYMCKYIFIYFWLEYMD